MSNGVDPSARPTFVVARNPDPSSRLGFLLRVPLPGAPLLLKAGAAWPATAKVYCHVLEDWPSETTLVEAVPVRSCRRRGVAVDLVLDRARQNRSQFVFTTLRGGREAIFRQSAATAALARPSVRIPTRRASGIVSLEILVDSRERYPYRFSHQQAVTERRALPVGDYGVEQDGRLLATVERKSLADLAGSLVDGGLAFAMAELAALGRAAVVVEERYSALLTRAHVAPGFLADLLARVQVRYPEVPIFFAGTRPLAEEWTYRFLAAARAELGPEAHAPPEPEQGLELAPEQGLELAPEPAQGPS